MMKKNKKDARHNVAGIFLYPFTRKTETFSGIRQLFQNDVNKRSLILTQNCKPKSGKDKKTVEVTSNR